jgi:outer membrane protein assembly factor BamB
MFRHDMSRTGNTTSRAPNTNNILWKHQDAVTQYTWGLCGSPAVANGVVYQGSQRPDDFYALNAVTGEQKWRVPSNGRVTSSPTVFNNRVLFTSYDKRVHSLFTSDGGVDWTSDPQFINYPDSSPTVYKNNVYVGTGEGDYVAPELSFFYSLDANTGDINWRFMAPAQIISSPTIVNDIVIIGCYDEFVYALPVNDPNGDGEIVLSEEIWKFHAQARVVASAAVEDGVIYIGTLDGTLYALPLIDPNGDQFISEDEVIWKFKAGNEIWSSVGIANGRVFVGSHDYNLYALPKKDPNNDGIITSSEVLWKYRTTDKIWSSPAIAGGKVFITSQDYKIWALNEETGVFIWNYTMPLQVDPFGSEYLYASPAVADGRIYVGNFDLTLYCFGSDDVTPPKVSSVKPLNNSLNVSLNTNLEIKFNDALCTPLFSDNAVELLATSGELIAGRIVDYNIQTRTMIFDPDKDLLPDERYTIRIKSRYFQDFAGNYLDGNGNGNMEPLPLDDYLWYFETGKQIGHKPTLENSKVTPAVGFMDDIFEFRTTYIDADGDVPNSSTGGFVKFYLDNSTSGMDMVWANDTNIPDSKLLDRNYANGELFRIRLNFNKTGPYKFYIECSDGNNTFRTKTYDQPIILNAPPELKIPVQYVREDKLYKLDLIPFVNDLDNITDDLKFDVESIYCKIYDHHYLACLFDSDDFHSYDINVTVSDGINSVSQKVHFVITHVNDAPDFNIGTTEFPQVTVYEDISYVFELDRYVTDPDTPPELLTVLTDSKYITTLGMDLYLLYPYTETFEEVLVSISDGPLTFETYLEVTVKAVNDPPILNVPRLEFIEDIQSQLNLEFYIKDEESTPGDLEIAVESERLGEITLLSGLWLVVNYPEGILDDYLNITVIDGNITVNQTVRVIIQPVNDAPGLTDPNAVPVSSDRSPLHNFTVWYSDEELILESGIEPRIDLVLNGELYSMTKLDHTDTLPPRRLYGITLELPAGEHTYSFKCNDGAGADNSNASTDVMTLEVSSTEQPEDKDIDTGFTSMDINRLGDLRNLFWLIFFIFAIIILVIINLRIFVVRRKERKRSLKAAPVIIDTAPKPEVQAGAIVQPQMQGEALTKGTFEPPGISPAKPTITPGQQIPGAAQVSTGTKASVVTKIPGDIPIAGYTKPVTHVPEHTKEPVEGVSGDRVLDKGPVPSNVSDEKESGAGTVVEEPPSTNKSGSDKAIKEGGKSDGVQ